MERLSMHQLEDLHTVFNNFDQENTGSLSKQALVKALQSMGFVVKDSDIRILVDEIDKNGNGVIDFDEYIDMMIPTLLAQNHAENEIIDAFQLFDFDCNGFITREKFAHTTNMLNIKFSDRDVENIFNRYDEERDRALDFLEFRAFLLNE